MTSNFLQNIARGFFLGSLFFSQMLIAAPAETRKTTIRMITNKSSWAPYLTEVAQRVLKLTEDPKSPDEIIWTYNFEPQNRRILSVGDSEFLDVAWTMTSKEREEHARPLRFDLFRGLMGYRVFLIRKGEQERFSKIRTVDDLKQMVFVQGFDYPDLEVLKSVGLKTFAGAGYEAMIEILRGKRADAFPRGIVQPWVELENPKLAKDFVVETDLMIAYQAPCYFFFSKSNDVFYKRFEKGIAVARADGSLKAIFNKHFGESLRKANLSHRRVFIIESPIVTKESKEALLQQKDWLIELPIKEDRKIFMKAVDN